MKNIDVSDPSLVDDPLRLSRLGHWLHASRLWWVAGLIAGLLLACGWSQLVQPRYGLDMLIRIGQAGRKVVEPPYVSVVRLQSPGFRQDVLKSLPDATSAGWKAAVVRDTNIIRVHVSGRQADVVPVANAVVAQLTARHQEMLQPMEEALKQLLASPACQADRTALPPRDAGTDAVDGGAIVALSKQDGFGLPCSVELKMLTAYPNTRATVLLEPVQTTPEPESRLAKLAVLGMLSGALLGFVLFLAYHFFRPQGRR